MGIPTAPMVTIAFHDLAENTAQSKGMPTLRIVYTPHPVWGKSPAEMYAYLEGDDPVTHKPLMPEVINALTKPLTAADERTGSMSGFVSALITSGISGL